MSDSNLGNQTVVSADQRIEPAELRVGDLVISILAHRVTVKGVNVHLTRKEFELLTLLVLRVGTTVTKDMMLDHLYRGGDKPELKVMDVFICKLRKKIKEACAGWHPIETVWGRGYTISHSENV